MAAVSRVPDSVLLRDVSRPAAGERPARHLHRLAAEAQIEGYLVFALAGHDRLFAVLVTDNGSRFEARIGIVSRSKAVGTAAQAEQCLRPIDSTVTVILQLPRFRDSLPAQELRRAKRPAIGGACRWRRPGSF